ncbi:MAG: NAD(P)H-dependent glycerol-3-phosphate dehydrogenase [Armatimonadota bacterium]
MSDSVSNTGPVAVIGAGAWGTTISIMLGENDHRVRLWARRPEFAQKVQKTRENHTYLPGFPLPDIVEVTSDLAQAVDGTRAVIMAVPSVGLRDVARKLSEVFPPRAMLIFATKGIERNSGRRMGQVLQEEIEEADEDHVVALSGPNLSREIAQKMPAVSVAASADRANAEAAQALLTRPYFRIYTNCDIIGVQLAGALKNVIAVGAGISDGLGFGDNAKASLITRGLAEIRRIGHVFGAMPDTFSGIAGVGDLIATCSSRLSRNWNLGNRVGRGEKARDVIQSMQDVAEGYYTTHAAQQLAHENGVEAPITDAVYDILYEGHDPGEVCRRLMSRRERAEHENWQKKPTDRW